MLWALASTSVTVPRSGELLEHRHSVGLPILGAAQRISSGRESRCQTCASTRELPGTAAPHCALGRSRSPMRAGPQPHDASSPGHSLSLRLVGWFPTLRLPATASAVAGNHLAVPGHRKADTARGPARFGRRCPPSTSSLRASGVPSGGWATTVPKRLEPVIKSALLQPSVKASKMTIRARRRVSGSRRAPPPRWPCCGGRRASNPATSAHSPATPFAPRPQAAPRPSRILDATWGTGRCATTSQLRSPRSAGRFNEEEGSASPSAGGWSIASVQVP